MCKQDRLMLGLIDVVAQLLMLFTIISLQQIDAGLDVQLGVAIFPPACCIHCNQVSCRDASIGSSLFTAIYDNKSVTFYFFIYGRSNTLIILFFCLYFTVFDYNLH